ncbi:MAG TPA: SDR family NAD(P)-dependent oxidoreductase, partial [Anaerolineaceae bacterium]|nr:SDR family NAD(P)-dependent oxidoreductase [Anaerolineaceae bacterium]
MDLGLKNKTALVTGGSRGLGFATARLLAQEGARVAINGRHPEALERAAAALRAETGADILALAGDVVDPSVPPRLMAAIQTAWGGLDMLVANAGGPPAGAFESFDDEA